MGVRGEAILKWEKGRYEPPISLMPAVIQFLGYDPYPKPAGYPERLLAKRREAGWTIGQAAERLDVNAQTWGLWERGLTVPRGRLRDKVEALLADRL